MNEFKFDRTAFKMMTFREADALNLFDERVSYSDRLRQAYFLISQAYGFSGKQQPKLDRKYFSSRKMGK